MSDVKVHSFNAMIAEEIGIEGAIIFGDLYFWCTQNKLNERNLNKCKDGKERYFTFNSVSALQKQYNYMSCSMIYKTLKTLEAKGYIIADNFNEHLYDRTKWYAVTEKGEVFYEKYSGKHKNPLYSDEVKIKIIEQEDEVAIFQNKDSIFQNEESILLEEEPIPDTNTNSNSDTTSSEDSSLRSESSSAPHDTGERKNSEKEGGTPLANKNLNSENLCEELETDKQIQIPNESNSDLSADEPCPWDAPDFMGMIKGSKYKSDGKTPQRRKRTPLAEREPVNDIERVEKAYITALADAEKLSPGVTEKSYTGFRNISAQRKRIKDWLKDYSAAEMAQAIRLAVQDNFCRNTLNMVFSSLLSDKIMTRLLNGDIRASPKKSEFSKPHEGFKDGQRDYSNTADW